MKKNPMLLAVACLLLGMFGCGTDEGVQKGYLAPQQTAPSSSPETSSASSSADPTSGEHLPAPSVTQNVSSRDSPENSGVSSSTPSSSGSSSSTVSSSSSSSSEPSPAAITKNDQRPGGGKVGGPGSSIRRQMRGVGEQKKPESKASKMTGSEQDEDASRVKTETAPSAVSSNLSAGSTRIAEPTGNVAGVIVTVNNAVKFVVAKFQYRAVPSVGKVLSVKRNGEKVGQIKVTAPIKPPHATADILDGEIQRGDTVE